MRLKIALLTAGSYSVWVLPVRMCKRQPLRHTENIEAQAYSLSSTNLDGISVYSSINSVSYKATDEPQEP